MEEYNFYITPEEYLAAEKNGISKKNLENRIKACNWDKEKAINTPVKKRKSIPGIFKELAKKNGITMDAFYNRVYSLGWDMERAATEPIQTRKNIMLNLAEKRRKYPKEYINMAKENGISEHTFRRRVRDGWNYKEAATAPVMTKKEIGLIVKQKFRWV